MKILMFSLLVLIVWSCKDNKPKLHKYYVVVERVEISIFSGSKERTNKVDTVIVENDSIAYWKGVIAYAASLRAENSIKKAGGQPPYIAKGWDVLDSNKTTIINRIPDSEKQRALLYIENNKN